MEFHSLETLFGATLSTGDLVISNSPSTDPRSGGLPEGHPPLLSYAGIPLLDADGMVGMIGLANRSGGFTDDDVARLQPLRAMLAQIISRDVSSARADTDPLTGLPNRAAFMKQINKLLAQSNRRRHQFGVLLIDLDGFKDVNDSNGHLVGDRVLCDAAKAAASTLRSEDMLARLGGDEFAVLLPDCDLAQMQLAGERVRETIRTIKEGVPPNFGASVGGVVATNVDTDWPSLYLRADGRLYEAKRQGGNRVVTSD
jgi:diguanylate cyclase (GGDEF)-like protein